MPPAAVQGVWSHQDHAAQAPAAAADAADCRCCHCSTISLLLKELISWLYWKAMVGLYKQKDRKLGKWQLGLRGVGSSNILNCCEELACIDTEVAVRTQRKTAET
jgi:hypothetical protein